MPFNTLVASTVVLFGLMFVVSMLYYSFTTKVPLRDYLFLHLAIFGLIAVLLASTWLAVH